MPKINIRRKAQLGLDIREGGIAIPIANNMFYIKGRKHSDGGVAIGPNNKNGIEVEGDEIVQLIDSNHPNVKRQFKTGGQQQTMRVFSSVPFLRGVSPAELVMGGANPDKVYKAQERYKDIHSINDDGTRYKNGGEKKSNSAIRTEEDKKVPAYNRAIYSGIDATYGYPNWLAVPSLGIKSVYKSIANPDEMDYVVTDSVADAAWRKRLGLSYDKKFLPDNEDGSVRLPDNISLEIPTDTIMLKNRIAANKKLAESDAIMGDDWKLVKGMIKNDTNTLNALRKTYKTGEPVVINEYSHNSRQLAKDGRLIKGADKHKTPLNVLQNFTIQYNPKTNTMDYRDTYDFNEFEGFVPGKPFDIKGSVKLKKYGGDDTKTAALKKLKAKRLNKGKFGEGNFGGGGAGSIIEYIPEFITDTITKRYLVPITQTFNDAFNNARQKGLKEFMFNNKSYNTKLGNNPNSQKVGNNRTQTIVVPIEHKEVIRTKKKYGGSMIYTINGNVKNGLMSLRPKAQFGKEKKINSTTKIEADGLIYTWGPDSEWYTDGTRYEDSKYYMREKSVLTGSKRSDVTASRINKSKTIEGSNKEVKSIETPISITSNKRPQYYAKTELPLFTPDDSVKRAGYRYGWSHNTNTRRINGLDYTIPDISMPASPAPRKGSYDVASTKTSTKASTGKIKVEKVIPAKTNSRLYEDAPIGKVTPSRVSFAELAKTNKPTKLVTSSTGGQTQPKLIGQYKPTATEDWIGLGSNLGAHLISYFNTKSFLDKYPMPTKPLITPAVKLKTRFNINSPLTELGEASQGQLNIIGRNTQSSSTSRAAQQRVINQTQRGRNQLYAQKENIETQLINQDRLNRQSIINRNMAAYNDWLDKTFNNKVRLNNFRASLINDTLTGMASGVGDMLSRIESRRNTNNTLRAIAAANPNVDARQIGGFDYYTDMYGRRYDRNGKLIKA